MKIDIYLEYTVNNSHAVPVLTESALDLLTEACALIDDASAQQSTCALLGLTLANAHIRQSHVTRELIELFLTKTALKYNIPWDVSWINVTESELTTLNRN